MSIDLNSLKPAGKKTGAPASRSTDESVSWLHRDIRLFDAGLGARKKEAFFLELGVLLKAGLDFRSALELVSEGMAKNDREKIFAPLLDAVVHGASLSEAMDRSGKFSAYDVYSLRIAEESGNLEPVLAELAAFYRKTVQHRRMMASALSYPAVVVLTAVGALTFLLRFLVPMFGDVYKRLHQDLPALTKVVVRLSEAVADYGGPIALLLAAVAGLLFWQRRALWFRRGSAWLLLRLPVVGPLLRLLYLNRFCSALAFLTGARVSVPEALLLTRKMIGFYPLETALDEIRHAVLHGQPLYRSMQAYSLFPRRMTALVKVGEEANKLDHMFARLSVQYDEEAEHRIKSLGALIEPILIVFLAVVVGFVLVAMYLPIFRLVTQFGE